jgi:hypothetical protein
MSTYTCKRCGFRGRYFMGAGLAHETAAKQLHDDIRQYALRQKHDALDLSARLAKEMQDATEQEIADERAYEDAQAVTAAWAETCGDPYPELTELEGR